MAQDLNVTSKINSSAVILAKLDELRDSGKRITREDLTMFSKDEVYAALKEAGANVEEQNGLLTPFHALGDFLHGTWNAATGQQYHYGDIDEERLNSFFASNDFENPAGPANVTVTTA